MHQRPTPYITASPPVFEIDTETLLAEALRAMRETVDDFKASFVSAISITAFGDGVWLLDGQGRAIPPTTTWRDTRSLGILERWRGEGKLEKVARLTGTRPTTAHQTTQMAWLLKAHPEVIERARHLIFAEDWIGYALTGEIAMNLANYEHTYGHTGRKRETPDSSGGDCNSQLCQSASQSSEADTLEVLELHQIKSLLPARQGSLEPRGTLKNDMAEYLGLPQGIPVFAGPFDVVTGMFGAGAIHLEQATSILGTAIIHQRWTDTFREDEPGYLVSHPQRENRWLRFIATSAGMVNLDYWRQVLYHPAEEQSWDRLEERLSDLPLGCDGLLYLPYLTRGEERSEALWKFGGCFIGIDVGHTPDHLMRAVYEGIALQAARAYQRLSSQPPLQEIRLCGGGGRSNFLAKLFANCTGLKVMQLEQREASLVGAAAIAWASLEPSIQLDSWAANLTRAYPVKEILPQEEHKKEYTNILPRIERLIAQVDL